MPRNVIKKTRCPVQDEEDDDSKTDLDVMNDYLPLENEYKCNNNYRSRTKGVNMSDYGGNRYISEKSEFGSRLAASIKQHSTRNPSTSNDSKSKSLSDEMLQETFLDEEEDQIMEDEANSNVYVSTEMNSDLGDEESEYSTKIIVGKGSPFLEESPESKNSNIVHKKDKTKSLTRRHRHASNHEKSNKLYNSEIDRGIHSRDPSEKKGSRDRVQFGSIGNNINQKLSLGQQSSRSSSREITPLQIEVPDSVANGNSFRRYLSRSELSLKPEFGVGPTPTLSKIIPEIALHRRTIALSHAIMTLALLSASASQLRFVVAYAHAHSYPVLNYTLICTCIVIEILAGIGYVILSRFDLSELYLEKIHSYLIFGLFIVAVANVIISAFALDDHVCEILAKRTEQQQYDTIDQSNTQQLPFVLT